MLNITESTLYVVYREIAEIAVRLGSTKTEGNKFLNGFIEVVQNTLAKGEEVTLIGFGKFHVTKRKAGKNLNPMLIPTIKNIACIQKRPTLGILLCFARL